MNRYWTLSGKPLGSWPEADTFVLREGPRPEPGPGQALTRTLYISLDPYQWGYKEARRRAARRALPRPHGRASRGKQHGRLPGRRPRVQHQRLVRVRTDERRR